MMLFGVRGSKLMCPATSFTCISTANLYSSIVLVDCKAASAVYVHTDTTQSLLRVTCLQKQVSEQQEA